MQPQAPQPNIFIEQLPEKKPVDKKGIGLTVFLTVLGVVVLLCVLLWALVSAADSLASDYKRRAATVLASTSKQLVLLEPVQVLDKRNLTAPLQAISLDANSQPQLPKVLLIGGMSKQYTTSERLQSRVARQYQSIQSYTDDLSTLLAFDEGMQTLFVEESSLLATLNKDDPNAVRAFAGTEQSYQSRIQKLDVPSELKNTRSQLVALYKQKAAAYQTWANLLETKDTAGIQAVQATLATVEVRAKERTADTRYVKLMDPRYETLLNEQKTVRSLVAH